MNSWSIFSYSLFYFAIFSFYYFKKSRTGSKYGCCIASFGRMRSFLSYRNILSSRLRASSVIMCLLRLVTKFVHGYFSNSYPFINFFTSFGIFKLYLCTKIVMDNTLNYIMKILFDKFITNSIPVD